VSQDTVRIGWRSTAEPVSSGETWAVGPLDQDLEPGCDRLARIVLWDRDDRRVIPSLCINRIQVVIFWRLRVGQDQVSHRLLEGGSVVQGEAVVSTAVDAALEVTSVVGGPLVPAGLVVATHASTDRVDAGHVQKGQDL
jgi:hypothetical protein